MTHKIQALYGLKWNPFLADVPSEALFEDTRLLSFRERVEHLATSGGYALLTGDPGAGKSAALRIVTKALGGLTDVEVGIVTRPQSSVFDFYRELGELFGVQLSPSNRWGGTKVLRDRWIEHIDRTGVRPTLVVDEAQEMRSEVLSEIRLLSSHMLDSQLLLLVILAGDARLLERLRSPDLLALATRIRVRLSLTPFDPQALREVLVHSMKAAGAAHLMSDGLLDTLATHAGGNLRVMMNMGAELLDAAVHKDAEKLDEALFFEVYEELGKIEASGRGRRRP